MSTFFFIDGAYHELPPGEPLPSRAVAVPRLPDEWEAWDGAKFVIQPEAISCLHEAIDRQAEQFRSRFITAGSGQAMTYLRKETEARSFLADPKASTPFLAAEASATGSSIADIARSVVARADAWAVVGPMIEAARIAAKQAVSQATTVAEMRAAAWVDWEAAITGSQEN